MIWTDTRGRSPGLQALWIGLCIAFLISPALVIAEDEADIDAEPQVWLLTYGPGEIYWQRFGHNAIWIRDPAIGLDHTFNFGFFDFAQKGFLRNFVLGRLNYFAAARPARVEIAEYIDANRSIRAQRLDLDPDTVGRLTDHLLNEISVENREYLYDYYRHNCSTRIRDALDLALNGSLRSNLDESRAPLNYRDHTRRLTQMDIPLYIGLQAGLASPVDRAISRWDETFIPAVLADAMAEATHPQTGNPVVVEEVVLYESSLQPPAGEPGAVWYRYLVISGLLLVFGALLCALPWLTSRKLALSWLSVAGLLGVVLGFLWLFTDHWVSELNLNLLLLNPLWLVIAVIPALRKPGAILVLLCGVVAVIAPWLPPWQYSADVVALVLPINLVVALTLIRRSPSM